MRLTNLLPARYLFIQPAALILTGAILIPFISIPAPAQPATPAPGNVLKGKDAFGDWRADAPGVRRLFTPDDVQPANPQPIGKEEGNYAQVVARAVGAQPLVPAGFNVEMIASGLAMPRVIRAAPNGDLFLAESGAGEIRVFHFSPGSVMPSPSRVFVSGLHKPYGIAFYPPGPYPKPETIISPIIWTHHWTRDIVFTPDGARMLLAVGSGSNVAMDMFPAPHEGGLEGWKRNQPLGAAWDTEEGRAQVLSYEPNGKFEKTIATGLRNPAGITIQPSTGQLWAVINERDGLGDDVPFEYATAVKEGAFYGWPWYYDGSTEEPRPQGART